MKRRFNMYRWMIVIGMIMLMEFSLSSAWAFTPSYDDNVNPADYRFQSTSPLLDNTPSAQDAGMPVTYGKNYGPYRSGWGENPGEDEPGVGVIIETPVGEPYILLLMAAAYFFFIRRRKKT